MQLSKAVERLRSSGTLPDKQNAELAMKRPNWHSTLITIKNAAYAWRQMVFYLSYLPNEEQIEFVERMKAEVAEFPSEFADRFSPALVRLANVIQFRPDDEDGGRLFLGWSVGRHWLMPNESK